MEILKIIFITMLIIEFVLLTKAYFRKEPEKNMLIAIEALTLLCCLVSYSKNKELELMAYIAGIFFFVVFLIVYFFYKKFFKNYEL